ncbi:MAG: hypothetical protein ACTTH8_07175 [Treponema sp.]
MIIQKNEYSLNPVQDCLALPCRFLPSKQEGVYIRYQLNCRGISLADIARTFGVSAVAVHYVATGRRRSRRVEAEIARVLGKASWNEVVAEARLAVSGNYAPSAKDVSKFLAQAYRQHQKQITAAQKRAEEGVRHRQAAAAKKAPREAV